MIIEINSKFIDLNKLVRISDEITERSGTRCGNSVIYCFYIKTMDSPEQCIQGFDKEKLEKARQFISAHLLPTVKIEL